MVIFAPIFQLGWRRASALVTDFSSSLVLPKKGPPEQVRMIFFTSRRLLPMRHWKMAECSESTGMISTPSCFASRITSSPAQTRVSLLARPMRLWALMAASVGFRPSIPTTAVMTQSTFSRVAASISPSSPQLTRIARSEIFSFRALAASSVAITASSGRNSRHCSAIRSTLEPAVSAATRTPSIREITSRL